MSMERTECRFHRDKHGVCQALTCPFRVGMDVYLGSSGGRLHRDMHAAFGAAASHQRRPPRRGWGGAWWL
jgi:hypothetical protein